MSLEVPEEAIEKAAEALKVSEAPYEDGEAWFRAHARAVVEAAAPLIVAAELERLVNETDWAWAVGGSLLARVAELRASVLRGEGDQDGEKADH